MSTERSEMLTAYWLGELTDSRLHTFEQELRLSPTLAAETHELGDVVARLEQHFSERAPEQLDAAHRLAVERVIATLDHGSRSMRWAALCEATFRRVVAALSTLGPERIARGAGVNRLTLWLDWLTQPRVTAVGVTLTAAAALLLVLTNLNWQRGERNFRQELPASVVPDLKGMARALARQQARTGAPEPVDSAATAAAAAAAAAPATPTPAATSKPTLLEQLQVLGNASAEPPARLSGPTEPTLPQGVVVKGTVVVECALTRQGQPSSCRIQQSLGAAVDGAVLQMIQARRYGVSQAARETSRLRLRFTINMR